MAVVTKDTLKGYFETGDFPSQSQFASLIDSLLHVGGSIDIDQVTGLQDTLNGLVQSAPVTGSFEGDDIVVFPAGQLVREIVFQSADTVGFTLRLKNDSDTDQEVAVEPGRRTVVVVNEWFDEDEYLGWIDPTGTVSYRIYRTF